VLATVLASVPGSRMERSDQHKDGKQNSHVNWGHKTANKGAGLRDGWKVFFDALLTRSRVMLIMGDLGEDSSFV
jgi:hypothetical protein